MNETGWTLESGAELRSRNTFALPCSARWLLQLHRADRVLDALALPELRGLPRIVLGGGSNVILPEALDAVVLHPRFAAICTTEPEAGVIQIIAEAGMNWHALVMHTVHQGWHGLENLALIPGQVGAAPIQNIGAYGVELADCLDWVEWLNLDSGRTHRSPSAELALGYRDSCFKHMEPGSFLVLRLALRLRRAAALRMGYSGVAEELARMGVTEATPLSLAQAIAALRRRKLPDPGTTPNAGSFFKNPLVPAAQAVELKQRYPELPLWPEQQGRSKLSAAWLIEASGCKGLTLGPAGVSAQHALVLVNHGTARGQDILALAQHVQRAVHGRFDVLLEIEPQALDAGTATLPGSAADKPAPL